MVRAIKSVKGMSLIEVMVVVAIMTIVALGIANMMAGMFQQMNQASGKAALLTFENEFRQSVLGQRSWQNTVNNVAGLACLRPPIVACNAGTFFATIRDGSAAPGVPIFGNYTNADPIGANNGQGFTIRGQPCNTFRLPGAGGNDACPFALRTRITLACGANPSPCFNPIITATLQPYFSPTVASSNLPFTFQNVYVPGAAEPQVFLSVPRAQGLMNDPIVYREFTNNNAGVVQGVPADCPLNWTNRLLVLQEDPNSHSSDLGGGNIQLNPGQYSCTASVPAFSVNGFRIRINVTGGPTFESSGLAPSLVQSSATVSGIFVLGGATTVNVQWMCQTPDATSQWDYGVPLPASAGDAPDPYDAPTVLSVLNCSKVN